MDVESNQSDHQLRAIARARARLLCRLRRRFSLIGDRFGVREDRIQIGAMELDFTRVADPEAVLDAICLEETRRSRGIRADASPGVRGRRSVGTDRNERPLRMPYWAAVWESAAALGELLQQNLGSTQAGLKGQSVLDLGCGMGLAGMVALSMGARVMMADYETDALLLAQVNGLAWPGRARVRRIDWNQDRLDESFDLIIGSDVLYERAQWEGFERFVRTHVRQGGCVWIGEPGRPGAATFPDFARERGWRIEQTTHKLPIREVPFNVFRLTPSPGMIAAIK